MLTQKKSIVSLLWIMFFDHTALNITFPILTLLFFDMHSSLFAANTSHATRSMWYGLCISIPHLMNIIVTPILSALSDEFGRKKILLIGTFGALLFALTAGLGIYWGILSLLFLGRFIQGAFSRTNPIAQAIVGDISSQDHKVLHMGYLQTAISFGAFLGPIIGGYFANRFFFATLNFSLPYFIAAIFAGISVLLTYFFFRETLKTQRHISPWQEFNFNTIKNVFFKKDVIFISIILLLSQMSWSLYYQFMPPILKTKLNFDPHELGWFVGLIALWLAIATSLGLNILSRFLSLKKILMLSIYLILIGLILTLLSCFVPMKNGLQYLIWIAAIPTAVGDVIAYSCLTATYSNVVEKSQQGKVMGICFIVVAFMWALTGLFGGLLMSIHVLMPLWVAPLGILVVLWILQISNLKFSNMII